MAMAMPSFWYWNAVRTVRLLRYSWHQAEIETVWTLEYIWSRVDDCKKFAVSMHVCSLTPAR